jgi:hypothetical protein
MRGWVTERWLTRSPGPASAFLDPLGNQALIGARCDTQLSGDPRSRFVRSTYAGAQQDACLLGQQIRTVAAYLMELDYRRGDLGLGRLAPAGMPLGDAGDPGHEEPVGVRCATISTHLPNIKHINDKRNLSLLLC